MFDAISPAPPDAILGLTEAFKSDTCPQKINLGVGVYKDNMGLTPVLKCVKEAEGRIEAEQTTKNYLPMAGSPDFGRLTQKLLFGEDHEVISSGRCFTAHSPGGTGGLRVGAETAKGFSENASIWMSKPTWANHKGIFGNAGMAIKEYPYYNPETKDVDWDGMREVLGKIPAGDVVLLHVCCHNPTGVDLIPDQWQEVADQAKARGWIPFLDFAYQGFGEGLGKDAAPLQPFLDAGVEMFIASSYSKNFGLYCERTGAITMVGRTADDARAGFSHMKVCIRRNYSNPPAHGGAIGVAVLDDETLCSVWEEEVATMRDRIKDMRSALV